MNGKSIVESHKRHRNRIATDHNKKIHQWTQIRRTGLPKSPYRHSLPVAECRG